MIVVLAGTFRSVRPLHAGAIPAIPTVTRNSRSMVTGVAVGVDVPNGV